MPVSRPSEPIHIAKALEQWLKESGSEQRIRAQNVIVEWELIVGAKLAQGAKPLKIADGELAVKAKNAVWRAELMMRRNEMEKKVNDYFKEEIVKKIVVK